MIYINDTTHKDIIYNNAENWHMNILYYILLCIIYIMLSNYDMKYKH